MFDESLLEPRRPRRQAEGSDYLLGRLFAARARLPQASTGSVCMDIVVGGGFSYGRRALAAKEGEESS